MHIKLKKPIWKDFCMIPTLDILWKAKLEIVKSVVDGGVGRGMNG